MSAAYVLAYHLQKGGARTLIKVSRGEVQCGVGRAEDPQMTTPHPPSRQLPARDETGCVFSGGAHGSETRGTGQAAKQQTARSWETSLCHRVPRLS